MNKIKLIVTACLLGINTVTFAQFMNTRSASNNSEYTENSGWSGLRLSYEFMELEKLDINGLSVGYAYAFPISHSTPIVLEFIPSVLWMNNDEDGDKLNAVSIATPVNFGYKLAVDNFTFFPYIGLNTRINVWGEGKDNYYGENFDLFDKDEGNCKRFQLGWHIGVGMHIQKFVAGISYGTDFTEFAKDADKLSSLKLSIGFNF